MSVNTNENEQIVIPLKEFLESRYEAGFLQEIVEVAELITSKQMSTKTRYSIAYDTHKHFLDNAYKVYQENKRIKKIDKEEQLQRKKNSIKIFKIVLFLFIFLLGVIFLANDCINSKELTWKKPRDRGIEQSFDINLEKYNMSFIMKGNISTVLNKDNINYCSLPFNDTLYIIREELGDILFEKYKRKSEEYSSCFNFLIIFEILFWILINIITPFLEFISFFKSHQSFFKLYISILSVFAIIII